MAPRPHPTRTETPMLVLVTGLPGTGKSTVAEAIATRLGAPVLAHDWAMSGLRPFPEVQVALDDMALGHRVVGWSILQSLARSELRARRSVVLDGVARSPEIDGCAACASSEGASLVVVATGCSDVAVHRARIEGRDRRIPNWYELEWADVERSRSSWRPPPRADLCVDTALDWPITAAALDRLFA